MRKLAVVLSCLAMASCATTTPPEPIVRTVEVKVPVAVSCVPASLPAPPANLETRESLRAAGSAEDRYQRIVADWLRRVARAEAVEPVIASCRR